MALYSCIKAVQAELEKRGFEADEFTTPLKKNWTIVNESDYKKIIRYLFTLNSLDCGSCTWKPDGFLLDKNRNIVQVAIRKEGEAILFLVWSPGPDGAPETPDDVVSRSGERIPPKEPRQQHDRD